MIRHTAAGDCVTGTAGGMASASGTERVGLERAATDMRARDERLRRAVEMHHDFLWRSARRFGVRVGDVEDVVQQAWIVFASKLDDVGEDTERAFLLGVVARKASHAHRGYRRRREDTAPDAGILEPHDVPSAEELTDRATLRATLDTILDAMDDEGRQVFVLYELEGIDLPAIARVLQLPLGTVKSRLRRARETYETCVSRLRRRAGGTR